MALIDVRHVYKIFNEGEESEYIALSNISLTIDQGEFVAIVGASGCGKSTLMNILGCLDIPTYGEYYLEGQEVSEMGDARLSKIRNRDIGFIFQGFNLIPALNAFENVELPLIYQSMSMHKRHEAATEALERVGLSNRMKNRPTQMSGGQQQRVAIARAIATKPPIIMADEPTGNLDSKTGAHIVEILHALHDEGRTIILITHDNNLAKTADRIIRISDGRIIYDSAVDAGEDPMSPTIAEPVKTELPAATEQKTQAPAAAAEEKAETEARV